MKWLNLVVGSVVILLFAAVPAFAQGTGSTTLAGGAMGAGVFQVGPSSYQRGQRLAHVATLAGRRVGVLVSTASSPAFAQGFVDAAVRSTTLRAHRTVTKAIRDQDPDAAARRMSRHVHTYAEAVMEVEARQTWSAADAPVVDDDFE